jgi:hypothetical protein
VESAVAVLRRRAVAIADAIVRRAPAGSVALVFAGGSLGRGRVWAARVGERLEVYSDIDLYVVVSEPTHADAVRRAAREAVAAAGSGEEPVLYLRGVDAGVYTETDLRAQPRRPGTVDLAAHHLPLFGDAARIAALLPHAGPIPAGEALYLLENRAWDAAAVPGADAAERRLARVLSLKADLDIACAHLILDGAPADAVADPARAIAAGAAADIDGSVRTAAARAAAARSDLTAFLALPPQDGDGDVLLRVCRAWLSLAPRVLQRPAADAGALVALRCARGRVLPNLREFVRSARGRGMSRAAALAAGAACSARSPLTTLRVHALVRGLERHRLIPASAWDGHRAHVERVTAAFGFQGGDLDARARAAHRVFSGGAV